MFRGSSSREKGSCCSRGALNPSAHPAPLAAQAQRTPRLSWALGHRRHSRELSPPAGAPPAQGRRPPLRPAGRGTRSPRPSRIPCGAPRVTGGAGTGAGAGAGAGAGRHRRAFRPRSARGRTPLPRTAQNKPGAASPLRPGRPPPPEEPGAGRGRAVRGASPRERAGLLSFAP